MLYDQNGTFIAVGGATRRLISDYTGAAGFPQQVGDPSNPGGTLTAPSDMINGYSDYLGYSPNSGHFSGQPGVNTGPREVLTEIQSFNLGSGSPCSNGCPVQTAQTCGLTYPLGTDTTMVRVGYNNTFNGGASFDPSYTPRSLGMVDSESSSGNPVDDFPAYSFFEIFPEITLPPINMTMSVGIIPLSGAVLTTVQVPLIIESELLGTKLPPEVVYIHQTTDFGVDLFFRDSNGPYWSAGDRLGTVTLAGHNPGVVNPCAKGVAVTAFINAVLGPATKLANSAVMGTIFGNADFPPDANSCYASTVGTNFDGSTMDSVEFTNGATTLFVRNIKFSNLVNPITLPTFGNSATYTSPHAHVRLQTSTDGHSWISGIATGAVQILIVNTNVQTSPSRGRHYIQLLSFSGAGATSAGQFKFQQDPSKISPGLHIVETNSPVSYKIGGYINASLKWSFDNGNTFKFANRPIQLKHWTYAASTDCGTVQPVINFSRTGTAGHVAWNNTNMYLLQSTHDLSPSAIWKDVPSISPFSFNVPATNRLFFRLICP